MTRSTSFPEEIARSISKLTNEYEEKSSSEALLAHEADLLECLLQAREYEMQGYTKGREWAMICSEGLRSETVKRLAEECLNSDPGDWFQNIQDDPRLTNSN